MRRPLSLPALLLALLAGTAQADLTLEGGECRVDSDYDLSLTERSVILTRASGTPRALVLRDGRMFIDGDWVTLGKADSGRIAAFERGARSAMPEAQAIGREAADIAFTALGGVAEGLSSDPAAVRAKLAGARTQLDARLGRSMTATRFDGRDLGEGIGDAVKEMVPMLVGDIVGGAIRAALTGDAARFERLDTLDARIEAQIRPRAERLEQRADRFCTRLIDLDRIDAALEYRLPDGRALNLLDARYLPRSGTTTAVQAARD